MERLKFRVNASFWVFLAGAIILKQGYFAAMYSIAMVAHETAHYLVAKRLFYRCTEIRLSIFGAVLYGDFADVCGADRIKIALAGPLCNFALCLMCLSLWWIAPDSYYFTETFFSSNLGMGCINLLPCYPLDGGRVFTGVLDKKYPGAIKFTKNFTLVLSVALLSLFVFAMFFGYRLFNLVIFALGLLFGVFAESGGECYVKSALINSSRFLKHGMEKKILVFDGNSKLCDVAKRMTGNYLYCLEVVDADMNISARYNIAQLENLIVTRPLQTPLKNLKR